MSVKHFTSGLSYLNPKKCLHLFYIYIYINIQFILLGYVFIPRNMKFLSDRFIQKPNFQVKNNLLVNTDVLELTKVKNHSIK